MSEKIQKIVKSKSKGNNFCENGSIDMKFKLDLQVTNIKDTPKR